VTCVFFNALTDKYKKDAVEFYKARQDYYTTHNYAGLGYEFIWKGSTAADAPLLTVYRHFDSASVHKGVLGQSAANNVGGGLSSAGTHLLRAGCRV